MRAKQSITAQRARFGHCDSTLHILSAPVHPKALRLRRLLGFTPLRSAGKAAGRAMSAGPERGRQTSVRRRRAPQGPGPRSPSPPPTPPRPGHCRAVLRAARGRWEATFRAPRSGPAAARGERDLTPCPHRSSRGANGPSPESGWAARRGARSPRGVASSAAALSDSGSLLLGFRLRTQHWPLNPVLHHRAAPAAPSPLDAVSTSRRRWPGFAVLPPQPPKQLGCQVFLRSPTLHCSVIWSHGYVYTGRPQGPNHQFGCWRLHMLIDSSDADQCFCFPSPTSQTTECIFRCLHLSEQCYSLHTYLLVSTRRLRTEISKSNLLYLIFNHHAVYMCEPVLP
ncbi:transmembrane protein 243 isoform X1 [Heterocephalus glaber]|uniref:Transmembrane protein 243 isoform X1 n=1 Tax=Heterocephalus glaber TaxID=10181 RepID=A0AAX6SLT6_HETGA|nr:transmembrane protein 243 isoform X1 [Heterocephalus glaber]XP_021109674.1 transmembrane protein 243 isoform X1 [Heterocephalus glaber]